MGRASLASACAAIALSACGASPPTGGEGPAPVVAENQLRVRPRNMPAFRALEAAVVDGEDELAWRIAAQLRLRSLTERETDLLEAFERVLTGRELVAALDLSLETVDEADGGLSLVLSVRQDTPSVLTLHFPPADLERLSVGIDGQGLEGRRYESHQVFVLEELEVAPGATVDFTLLSYEQTLGRALALRELWRLAARSGEIVRDGVAYPAAELPDPRCERIFLAADLSEEPVEPIELIHAFQDDETTPEDVLRMAVRVPREDQAECLVTLTPVIEGLAAQRPERVGALSPALRWLARTGDPGADPDDWVRWLRAWNARGGASVEAEDSNLDLPADSSKASKRRRSRDGNLDLP